MAKHLQDEHLPDLSANQKARNLAKPPIRTNLRGPANESAGERESEQRVMCGGTCVLWWGLITEQPEKSPKLQDATLSQVLI